MRWLPLLVCLLALPAHAETRVFDSGHQRVTLLELYTSEGCSSCPPADAWFSTLVNHPQLWERLVPVAFHVDYWDRLGWHDRFGDARFSSRQQRYAALWGHGVVYTPGFVVDGREWRGGPRRGDVPLDRADAAGRLTVRMTETGVDITYEPSDRDAPVTAHLALLGFGRETAVDAGENRGRRLHHDFVVLEYWRQPLRRLTDGRFGALADDPPPAPGPTALAVWVTEPGTPVPLQAVGGWLQPPDS